MGIIAQRFQRGFRQWKSGIPFNVSFLIASSISCRGEKFNDERIRINEDVVIIRVAAQ